MQDSLSEFQIDARIEKWKINEEKQLWSWRNFQFEPNKETSAEKSEYEKEKKKKKRKRGRERKRKKCIYCLWSKQTSIRQKQTTPWTKNSSRSSNRCLSVSIRKMYFKIIMSALLFRWGAFFVSTFDSKSINRYFSSFLIVPFHRMTREKLSLLSYSRSLYIWFLYWARNLRISIIIFVHCFISACPICLIPLLHHPSPQYGFVSWITLINQIYRKSIERQR